MTEAEWRVSVNPQKMIAALSGKGSERLWRLFAVACTRRVEHLMRDPRSRKALAVAERFADGAATREELTVARIQAAVAWLASAAASSPMTTAHAPSDEGQVSSYRTGSHSMGEACTDSSVISACWR